MATRTGASYPLGERKCHPWLLSSTMSTRCDVRSDHPADLTRTTLARQFTEQFCGNHSERSRRVSAYAIRVKGENTTVLGSDVQNISHSLTGTGQIREVQRLRIHFAVTINAPSFPNFAGFTFAVVKTDSWVFWPVRMLS